MRAILLQDKGQWQSMRIGEISKPSAGRGQVLVKVHAVGLNPVDYKMASSGHPDWIYPHILGLDVAGTIEEVGEDAGSWQIGDRVLYHGDLTKPGGCAEYAVTNAHTISRIPEYVDVEEAAALPTAGYTAYQAVFGKLPLPQVETVLIQGGAGGVGGFAVQLARLAGKKVIATASAPNHKYVLSLGANIVLDYRECDLATEILKLTEGCGVDAVIDTISRQSATDALTYTAFAGHIVHIAGAPDYGKIKPFTKALSIHEVALGAAYQSGDIQAEQQLAIIGNKMLKLLADHKLSSMLSETIALEQIPEALLRLSQRHVRGKIIVRL